MGTQDDDATRTGGANPAGGNAGGGNDSNAGARTGADGDASRTGNPVVSDDGSVDWKAAARKWEDQFKRAESKLAKIEDSQKTELQRAVERAQAAEHAAAEAELRSLRLDVASKVGLPSQMAARLRGTNEAELTEDATALAAMLAPANGNGQQQQPQRRPDPDQGKGDGSGSAGATSDMNTWFRQAAGRRPS